MRRLGILLFLTLVIAAGLTPAAHARPMTGRYIVVLKASANARTVARSHARLGVKTTFIYRSALRGYAAAIPISKLAVLRRDPRVASIRPDRVVRIAAQTTPTGVQRMSATLPGTGGGVHVAVIDTGVDTTHPDLAASIAGGVNCTNRPQGYKDENGHGTHVAGIVAAANDTAGVRGVAPGAKVWSVRVLDHVGYGTESQVVCGIDFVDARSPAKGGPIKVANMSLVAGGSDDGNCGYTNGDPIHQAVCRAVADGVTMVVAAGNEGNNVQSFVPAAYDEVITVSALADSDGKPCGLGSSTWAGSDDGFASFSNYATLSSDRAHMIAAPGVDIVSTYKGGGYAEMSGTSMASPHVAGAVARYVASHPGTTPSAVLAALRASGEPINTNVGGVCTGGLGVAHTDSLNRHPEPMALITPIRTPWSRYSYTPVASTGNPVQHGR